MNHWRDIPTEADLYAHLARRGASVQPVQDRAQPAVPPPPAALEALFQQMQALARRHGWKGQYTYNGHGPDTGLHMILVREALLFAEVTLDKRLSPSQQGWIDALVATGQVEVYVWGPEDLAFFRTRITQPRTQEQP